MIPPLWSDEEVEEREDGYLIIKNGIDPDLEQPLLLHSSEVFLKHLYPEMSREAFLAYFPVPLSEQEGSTTEALLVPPGNLAEEPPIDAMDIDVTHQDDDNGGGDDADNNNDDQHNEMSSDEEGETAPQKVTEKKELSQKEKEALKYQQVYQSLKRSENLANRIQPLVSDLQSFKHRPNKRAKDAPRSSRDKVKVRALELQQEELLKKHGIVDSEGDTSNRDGHAENDEEKANEESPRETHLVRLVRTINSIRAIYSHLFQMFNHKRRNDKLLNIGNGKLKSRKRGVCWLLGSQVYDTSSSKLVIGAHKDCSLILESFISVETARTIWRDPLGGSPDFWSKSWIVEVKARASPSILDPLSIITSFPNAPDREAIINKCQLCDEGLHLESTDANAEEIQAQYNAAVSKLRQKISDLLQERFPEARISIYGSCLSDLSLGKGADVDLSLWMPKAEQLRNDFERGRLEANAYEKRMKSFVFQVFHKLNNCGHMFRDLQPVTRARVPVVKGTYNFAKNPYAADGSLKFDICFLNDIAVANSGLIREYALVDPRVRKLMMAVKLFAKDRNMNSAKDSFISSYAWVNLVVFYLQCVGAVPLLQDAGLMKQVGFVPDREGNVWHAINNLDTWYLRWNQVKDVWSQPPHLEDASVTALLYGFFEFYSRRFPSATYVVSIKQGAIEMSKLDSPKPALFFSIEDPFETYDSYCPHDLSSPAGDGGTRDMLEYLGAAEIHLRDILLGKTKSSKLWPSYGNKPQGEATENTAKKAKAGFTRTPIENKAGLEKGSPHEQTRTDKNDGGPGRGGRGGRGPRGRGFGQRTGGRGGRGAGQRPTGRGDRGQNVAKKGGAQPETMRSDANDKQNNQKPRGSNNTHKAKESDGGNSSNRGGGGGGESGSTGNNRRKGSRGKPVTQAQAPAAKDDGVAAVGQD